MDQEWFLFSQNKVKKKKTLIIHRASNRIPKKG